MNRPLALLAIGLVFGGGAGFLLAAANGVTLDGHDHATDHGVQANGTHSHEDMLDISANGLTPGVALTAEKDTSSGWNLRIDTTGFEFSPENSGGSHRPGEGHAHLYANGVKIARVYGPWFHVAALPEGEVEMRVTLNSNDHRALAIDGVPVAASIIIRND